MNRTTTILVALMLVLLALLLLMSACGLFSQPKPAVFINSPLTSSQFREGEQVSVQSTATDPKGITRIELAVDGNIVHVATPPTPQPAFTTTQNWTATTGLHTITVRAFNSDSVASDPAAIAVIVGGGGLTPVAQATATPGGGPTPVGAPTLTPPAPAPTAPPAGACANGATFLQDVTIPDGTTLLPGQSFNKVWRVRNSGTCAWTPNYRLTFVGGDGLTQIVSVAVPNTPPNGSVDLLVPMTAPNRPGSFTSNWQMQSPSGPLFGDIMFAAIRVPSATPQPSCTGTPNIASFTATPTTVNAGEAVTLNWGFVSNADRADIDRGIGGVATPGNVTVRPTSTTTYTLTARCGATTRTAQVTVTVRQTTPTRTRATTPTATTPSSTSVTRCTIGNSSGEVIRSGNTRATSLSLNVGDDQDERTHRAFFTFDLAGLAGRTVDQATLRIGAPTTRGNPFNLGPLIVELVEYPPPVSRIDYDRAGTPVLTIVSGPTGQYDIQWAVQNAASANRPLFQLRFRNAAETNEDDAPDMFSWSDPNSVCLDITYR